MTKIDIISGFLGAGKTTFIKKIVGELLKEGKVVLIENEFGEIGIDGGFLQDAGIEMKEMNSGCICCSLVGDFAASLKEVVETYAPDRIIIEPSGVGKLSDVMKAIENAKSNIDFEIDSAITVVDATKCKMYSKNFGEFFINQIENADTIVLSRTRGLSDEKMEKCMDILRKNNSHATIITTPWDQLEAGDILKAMKSDRTLEEELFEEEEGGCCCGHHHHEEHECGCGHHHHEEHECGCGHHHHEENECSCGHHDHEASECGCGEHHHHHAEEIFTSWGMETPHAYTSEEIAGILEKLEDEKTYGMILRAKGMLPDKNGEWNHFDYVPGECEVRKGRAQITGKICVIGSKLAEDKLKELFER